MAYIRLDKYLADAGQGTRSQVKNLIRAGCVSINGEPVKKGDIKLDADNDVVELAGKRVVRFEYEYYMLNKPAGVVSATSDNRDKTVIELITEDKRRDLFPVGRLDKDTEGLLIITNDGILANNLLAHGKHVSKKYYARVQGKVTEDTVRLFESGLDIGDERITAPAELEIMDEGNESSVNITITEGRYHQIKRMFQAVGMEVLYLKRLSMGNIELDDSLKCGDYRRLTDEEIRMLKEVHKHSDKIKSQFTAETGTGLAGGWNLH